MYITIYLCTSQYIYVPNTVVYTCKLSDRISKGNFMEFLDFLSYKDNSRMVLVF